MVDFRKKLSAASTKAVVHPVDLYDTLDRAVDKGPLRPAQEAVLREWFEKAKEQRDVIVKLHTGQGKTLIGLLMLQSRLNERAEPSLYLCPNKFLADQTRTQATEFGIRTCDVEDDLPDDFLDGKRILVTTVHKLFNGLTRFKLGPKSISVGTLLMDDAHACSDAVRDQFKIRLTRGDQAYNDLLGLFSSHLEMQGVGRFADIVNEDYNALLPVPYWAWIDREKDVAAILSKSSDKNNVKFTWPLLRDILPFCQCVVSGAAIEIEPYAAPLDMFGSYWKAGHRVFMSVTVTDDAFLVKGLRLSAKTISNPLTYAKERWSGEKMVLLPGLLDEALSRTELVHRFAAADVKRKFGVVALIPSFKYGMEWKKSGAAVAELREPASSTDAKDLFSKRAEEHTVQSLLNKLRNADYERTVVLVNRYDGIDLPDSMCRILVFDGRPYSENLSDLLQEGCRGSSQATLMRTVRTIEQGLGRSVRGEKDYSAIVVIGTDITKLIRDRKSRVFFSSQMDTQVAIGLEIAEMAKEEIQGGKAPDVAFLGLIRQCLDRDPDWKAFYADRMDSVKPKGPNTTLLSIYERELDAEMKYQRGDFQAAVDAIQKLLDEKLVEEDDRGWYLQEIARYFYRGQRDESRRVQIAAHGKNHLLLKPPEGVSVKRLTVVSQRRMERISAWIGEHETYDQLQLAVDDMLSKLAFGVKADTFEGALKQLGEALGFGSERPDKEWKEGPDNLWALGDDEYVLWECKDEVESTRSEINKHETDQMNRSCAWFEKVYGAATRVRNLMVIPTYKVSNAAAFRHPVQVVRKDELGKLVSAVRSFFQSFESLNLKDLSLVELQKTVDGHHLGADNFMTGYAKDVRERE